MENENNQCNCGVDAVNFCAKCHVQKYCSRKCQVEDWPNHKKYCKKWSIDRKCFLTVCELHSRITSSLDTKCSFQITINDSINIMTADMQIMSIHLLKDYSVPTIVYQFNDYKQSLPFYGNYEKTANTIELNYSKIENSTIENPYYIIVKSLINR